MPFADIFAKYPQWGIPLFGPISDKGRQGPVKGASQGPAGGERLMEVLEVKGLVLPSCRCSHHGCGSGQASAFAMESKGSAGRGLLMLKSSIVMVKKKKSESVSHSVVSNSSRPDGLCRLPDFSVHGILQARIPEWVAIPFARGSSQPSDQTRVSCVAGRFFTVRTTFWRLCNGKGADFG